MFRPLFIRGGSSLGSNKRFGLCFFHSGSFLCFEHSLWSDLRYQRKFLEEIGFRLRLKDPNDWYKLEAHDIINTGSECLFHQFYRGSFREALISIFPEHDWQLWRFSTAPRHYWNNLQNQRNFLEWIEKEFKIKNLDDWYEVTREGLISRGAYSLISLYGQSLMKTLIAFYPEHKWRPWKFRHVPRGFWSNTENVRDYMGSLSNEWRLTDWRSRWSCKRLKSTVIRKSGGLNSLLEYHFPWKQANHLCVEHLFTSQMTLLAMIKMLFADDEVILSNHRHPMLFYSTSGKRMELDLFLPVYNIAFEYQGEQHKKWSVMYGFPEKRIWRDHEKATECERHGITCIPISYHINIFNKGWNPLIALIRQHRPELLNKYEAIIDDKILSTTKMSSPLIPVTQSSVYYSPRAMDSNLLTRGIRWRDICFF